MSRRPSCRVGHYPGGLLEGLVGAADVVPQGDPAHVHTLDTEVNKSIL